MIPARDRVLLQVWWTDCTNVAGGWHDDGALTGFATDGAWECSNTGWLVYEDDRCYVLAGRLTDDGCHAGLVERIPKTAVTAMKTFPAALRRQPMPEYEAMIGRNEDGPDPLVPEPTSAGPKAAEKANGGNKTRKGAKAAKKTRKPAKKGGKHGKT